jgi:hypothetical protein
MLTGFPEGLLLSFNVKPRVLTAFTSEVVESFVFAFVGLVYVLWVLCPGFLWLRFGLGFYAFASGCVCVCVVLCVFYRFYVFYGRFYVFYGVLYVFYECLKPRFRSVLYSAFFLYIYLFKYILFFFLKKEYI